MDTRWQGWGEQLPAWDNFSSFGDPDMKSCSMSDAEIEAVTFGVNNISRIALGSAVYDLTGAPGRLVPKWTAKAERPME